MSTSFTILKTALCFIIILPCVYAQFAQVLRNRQCAPSRFLQLGSDINATLPECFQRCLNNSLCQFAQYDGSRICQLLRFCDFFNGPGSGFNIYIRNASRLVPDRFTQLTTNGRCNGVAIQQDNEAVSLTGCIFLCDMDTSCEFFQYDGNRCFVYASCLLEENGTGFQVYSRSPIPNPQCNGQGTACSQTESYGRCCRSLECRLERFPRNGVNYTCQNAGQFRDISPPAGIVYTVHAVNSSCIGQQLVGDTNLASRQDCIDLCSYNPDCAYVIHTVRSGRGSCSLSSTADCRRVPSVTRTVLRKRLDCLGGRGLCTQDSDCCDDLVCLLNQDKYRTSRCGEAALRTTVTPIIMNAAVPLRFSSNVLFIFISIFIFYRD